MIDFIARSRVLLDWIGFLSLLATFGLVFLNTVGNIRFLVNLAEGLFLVFIILYPAWMIFQYVLWENLVFLPWRKSSVERKLIVKDGALDIDALDRITRATQWLSAGILAFILLMVAIVFVKYGVTGGWGVLAIFEGEQYAYIRIVILMYVLSLALQKYLAGGVVIFPERKNSNDTGA